MRIAISSGSHGRSASGAPDTLIGRPPSNGSSSSGSPAPKYPTTKWPGRPTPDSAIPARRAASM